jgi:luciferase family oxidoreductase group 1
MAVVSALDLSVVNDGQTSVDALRATTAFAQAADRLGFHRLWVAEHHNMPSVACTSPPVLIAHLAASTERIRVGSGGVMLPNHAPFVVAEQFAMLEALHPGRIDVGIGRAPGSDQRTAAAVRRSPDLLGANTFVDDLVDLLGLLGDPRAADGVWDHLRATPAATTHPTVFLLGSSDYSARLAAELGLPFAFAHHFDMGGTLHAAELYLAAYRPSAAHPEAHLIVTANVLLADTREEADWHAAPGRLTTLSRRTGRFIRLPSPTDAAAHPDLPAAERLPTGRAVGTVDMVLPALRTLVERTGAHELMVTCVAYDTVARTRSLELLSQAW